MVYHGGVLVVAALGARRYALAVWGSEGVAGAFLARHRTGVGMCLAMVHRVLRGLGGGGAP